MKSEDKAEYKQEIFYNHEDNFMHHTQNIIEVVRRCKKFRDVPSAKLLDVDYKEVIVNDMKDIYKYIVNELHLCISAIEYDEL